MSQDQVFGSYEQLEAEIVGLSHGGGSVSPYADYAAGAFGFRVAAGRDPKTGDTEEELTASTASSRLLIWKKFGADLSSSVKDAGSLAELVEAMTPSTLTAVEPATGYLMVIDYSGASEGAGGSSKVTRLSPEGWNAAPVEQRMQLRGAFRLRRWQEVLGIVASPTFSAQPARTRAAGHGMADPRFSAMRLSGAHGPTGPRARKFPPRGNGAEDLRAARGAARGDASVPRRHRGGA